MNNLSTDDSELNQIAILHDIKEDCGITTKQLYDMGFSERVVKGICKLTHQPEMPYDDYIKEIASSEDAVRVKIADLKDNSDITRLKGLTKKDFDRMEKYHKAYIYLSKIK
jgi:GTP diphosphokinase / guanosine-3',5'-bis(diphosphate) 3'-diphosphatase